MSVRPLLQDNPVPTHGSAPRETFARGHRAVHTVVSLDSGSITTRGAPALACGGAAPMWRCPRDHPQLSSFSASRFGQIRRPWVLLKSVCAARRGHLCPPKGASKFHLFFTGHIGFPARPYNLFTSPIVLGCISRLRYRTSQSTILAHVPLAEGISRGPRHARAPKSTRKRAKEAV